MLEQALAGGGGGGGGGGGFEDQVLKFMGQVPREHGIVLRLLDEAAASLPSAADERRAKAAVLFRVVAKHAPPEKVIYFVLHLLADPSPRLRERGVRLMLDRRALGSALCDPLRAILTEAGNALLKAATAGGAKGAKLVPMLTPPAAAAAAAAPPQPAPELATGPLAGRLSQWAGRVMASLHGAGPARGGHGGGGVPGTPATPGTPGTPSTPGGPGRGSGSGIAGDGLPEEMWGTRADPCNAALLSSPAYQAAARAYGLPPAALRIPENAAAAAGRMLAGASKSKGAAASEVAEEAAERAAAATLAPAAFTVRPPASRLTGT
eukprot:tig00021013_g17063.t1